MIPLRPAGGRTILCLGAHPDDIEIGCGGTLLRWLAEDGRDVHWVVFSGEGARADEARRGAERFLAGASSATMEVAGFQDAGFPWQGAELKAFFRDLGGRVQPDVVFTHRLEDRHQDHRLIAELTWQTFRDHLILEYEIPKYEGDLGRPTLYAPVDDATAHAKVDSIVETFASQRSKRWFSADTFRALMRLRGLECAAPHGWAEAFTCRKAVL